MVEKITEAANVVDSSFIYRESAQRNTETVTPKYEDDLVMEDPVWNVDRIGDWDSRISHYPDKIKRFYHKMIPKV